MSAQTLTTGWEADVPVDDSIVRRYLFHWAACCDAYATAAGGATKRTDAWAAADLRRPSGYFNSVTLLQPPGPDFAEHLDEIDSFYETGSGEILLWSIWPTPDLGSSGTRSTPASPPSRSCRSTTTRSGSTVSTPHDDRPNPPRGSNDMTLPPIDPVAVETFWREYSAAVGLSDDARYADAFHFGDHPTMVDELLELVLSGRKRATASGLAELESAGLPVPQVGDQWIVCDGRSRPRVVGTTTDVRIGSLQSVDDAFAFDEGEDDRTRADWLHQHEV